MKLTMSGEALSHTFSLDKAIEITKSFEVRNFELWARNCESHSDDIHPSLFKNRDIAKAKSQFKAADIHVACVAFGGAFFQAIAENENLYTNELIRSIEIAEEIGAEYVNHYCNLIAPQPDIDFDVLERYYSKPLKRAEELGIIMVLENEAHDMTHSPQNVLEIIRYFGSKNFQSNLDATNFYQAGNEAFPFAYEVLKPVFGYIHIKNGCIFMAECGHDADWKGGDMAGHLSGNRIFYTQPDKGAVNIYGLMKRLQTDSYNGYLTLEPHSTIENVLDYYKRAIPLIRDWGAT